MFSVGVGFIRRFIEALGSLVDSEHYLFTLQDLRALAPEMSESGLKGLLSRATRAGHIDRVCRGLYLMEQVAPSTGLLLFHAATKLRADHFNYISLETVLSEAGLISQIPFNWISIMSSGRSNIISCGKWGTIEFVHTNQAPENLVDQLDYDPRCRLWRAKVSLAMRDMRATRRSLDLIDWSIAHEFV